MVCEKNEKCKTIADNIANTKKEIDGNFLLLDNDYNEMNNSLTGISEEVPMETATYLGNKVVEALDSITSDISSLKDELNSEKNRIDTELQQEINLHKSHYNQWLSSIRYKVSAPNENKTPVNKGKLINPNKLNMKDNNKIHFNIS